MLKKASLNEVGQEVLEAVVVDGGSGDLRELGWALDFYSGEDPGAEQEAVAIGGGLVLG